MAPFTGLATLLVDHEELCQSAWIGRALGLGREEAIFLLILSDISKGNHRAGYQPVEQHPDAGEVLLHRRRCPLRRQDPPGRAPHAGEDLQTQPGLPPGAPEIRGRSKRVLLKLRFPLR
ncbi:hypothetical protein SBA4_3580011 [Candidatus Sulfopaludibacter sp. SbA4]|nr:hypothetical protein SBA4_3580011 [Candidatus Sulfopaludibacter sp. SbA4]